MKLKNRTSKSALAALLGIGLSLSAGQMLAVDKVVDKDVSRILNAMADYLGSLQAFKVAADVDTEIIDFAGQKLQLSSDVDLVVSRPDKMHMHRHGAYADMELFYDGQTLSVYNKDSNAYKQFDASGNVQSGIERLRESGIDAPGADLLFTEPYPALTSEATNAEYRGTAFVNGVECDYLTFRGGLVDWQLWVRHGDKPVPVKYVITTKWMTAAPQYSVRFRQWDITPKIPANQFVFTPPGDAAKVESMNTIAGELLTDGGLK